MSDEFHGQAAIVGMACRFPGAKNTEIFWDNLIQGVESVTFFSEKEVAAHGMDPAIYQDPNYVRAAAIVDDAGMFDAAFFGMSPAESTLMDPQIRLFLEVAWESLENAGVDPVRYPGRIGCYAGASINKYIFMMAPKLLYLKSWESLQARILNDKDYIATWTAYKLNLKGPAMSVQTACSTSMVALHLGCQSLTTGESDMIIAGGSTVEAPQTLGYTWYAGGIGSKDGHCRPFDAAADGTISANGAGAVVVKRLADAIADRDHIHAVILATAVNNDGSIKVSYTAPSVDGQADAVAEALDVSGVHPETIGYVEAHGTGTAIGDPIEISALTDIYREHTPKTGYCAIGSVKANFGHLDVAAGVAGIIKTALSLQHGQIPPLLHFNQPNPVIDFESTPFFPVTALTPWPESSTPRRAAVSSFGVGGTNAHTILEQAPSPIAQVEAPRPHHLFLLSAKTPTALETAASQLADYLAEHPNLDPAEAAYTLQVGRGEFPYRKCAVANTTAKAAAVFRGAEPGVFTAAEAAKERRVVFMFPGQGAQFPGMFRQVYASEPVFSEELDVCCDLLIPHLGLDPREILFPEDDAVDEAAATLARTELTQPILFAVEFSLAQLWLSRGVEPDVMIGHSVGEYVAATLAGVFSLEDALRLVCVRGRLMNRVEQGAMAALPLPEHRVKSLLGSQLSLAAVNGPESCVVSGPTQAVTALTADLAGQGVPARQLHTSHAYHSAMMEPILEEFAAVVRRTTLNPPEAHFISNRTGTRADHGVTSPDYWVSHLRDTVRFSDGVHTLLAEDPDALFLEVGPGVSLAALVKQHPAAKGRHIHTSSAHPKENRDDAAHLLNTLGQVWTAGVAVSWEGYYGADHPYKTPLPTYPFERRLYWYEADPKELQTPKIAKAERAKTPGEKTSDTPEPGPRHGITSMYQAPRNDMERKITAVWSDLLGVEHVGVFDHFMELGGQSLLAAQVMIRLSEAQDHRLDQDLLFQSPTPASLAEAVAVAMLSALDDAQAVQLLEDLGAASTGSITERVTMMAPNLDPLFERLNATNRDAHATAIERSPRQPEGDLLSFSQQRLWFLEQLEEAGALNNVPLALRLEGLLDREALSWSLSQIMARHEVLRAHFPADRPVQLIRTQAEPEIPLIDLSSLDEDARHTRTQDLFRQAANQPFNIAEDLLIRAQLIRHNDQDHIFHAVLHHMVTDAWSIGVLVGEFAALYNARVAGRPSPLAPLPIQYADFAAWQRRTMQGDALESKLAFWRQTLNGAPPVLDLPTDRPRPALQRFRGAAVPFRLDHQTTTQLQALGKRQGASLFMVLLTTFDVLLQRYTHEDDLLIGTPVANRNHAEIQQLMGVFINTIVLRTDCSGNPKFQELLTRVRQGALAAFGHGNVPFEALIEDLKPKRNLSYSPVFQVMFNYHATPMATLELSALKTTRLDATHFTSRFDLTFELTEIDGRLAGAFLYDTDLFDERTIQRMADHYHNLLVGVTTSPHLPIAQLPLLKDTEQQQLLVDWNATTTTYDRTTCFHHLFEAVAARNPDKIAVWDAEEAFTYAQLNDRADRLAASLVERGAGPEQFVGLFCDRGRHMLTGLLAVMKAGAAYLPLDPAYPSERLDFMISETMPPVILTQRNLMTALPRHNARLVFLNEEETYEHDPLPTGAPLHADHLAYIIFTSGSTGKPKGVQISHRALVNFLETMRVQPGITSEDVLAAVTTISFDIAGLELYLPLLAGAAVVIPQRDLINDGVGLSALIAQKGVTIMQATPATWRMLIATRDFDAPGLKALCGGEALPRELALALLDRTRQLWNVYGPTETTIWSTAHRVTREELPAAAGEALAIGRPIANTTIYLLDSAFQPVPVGVPGNLYIGGEGLARGYFNRPDLTAERFLPNPFPGGGRLYHTGDKARYRHDGVLVFLGRTDNQVKLRGFRIELGEIEAVLAKQPGVDQAVIMIREDSPGNPRLAAYFTGPEPLQTVDLRDRLRRELPEYMIPNAFMQLEAVPLTPNGKVNRRALPIPDATVMEAAYHPPRTPQEGALCAIYAEVLGHERVGVRDDFFELGGHSLPATQMTARIRETFDVDMSVRDIFEAPTIERLAPRLDALMTRSEQEQIPFHIQPRDVDAPLSSGQTRLWFLDRLEGAGAAYNIPVALRMKGALNVDALTRTLDEILNRHEALRTTFDLRNGAAVQIIHPPQPFQLPLHDLQPMEPEERTAEMKRRTKAHANFPFNLQTGPLFKADLLRLSEMDHLLLVNMSHIVSDGWSLGVLLHEYQTLYQAFYNGLVSPLPALPIQYIDFAARQRVWLESPHAERELAYWQTKLAGLPTLVEIPTDRPRPATQSYRGAFYRFTIPRDLTDALIQLSHDHRAGMFMTLLSALGLLQSRYSGMTDIPIGSPIAGRTHLELEGLIGFFVNSLVLRMDFSRNKSFEDLLEEVRQTTLEAYAHQHLPFETLVERLSPDRGLSHSPMFQTMLVYQNTPLKAPEMPQLKVYAVEPETEVARFDMTLFIREEDKGLACDMEYNIDLFEPSTMARMMTHFVNILEQAAMAPQRPLSRIKMLDRDEYHRLTRQWNHHGQTPPTLSIQQQFENQVAAAPDKIALQVLEKQAETGDAQLNSLTYQALNVRANKVAHLLRQRGVQPDTPVGVCMTRTVDLMVAILGVLKADACYVPLDPAYPSERLTHMFEDSNMPLILTRVDQKARFPEHAAAMICLDGDGDQLEAMPEHNPSHEVHPNHLAYVLYTSGSTGTPKAVAIQHRNAAAMTSWAHTVFSPEALASTLASTSVCFDLSVFEMFVPLTCGGKVVMVENAVHLTALPQTAGITLINTVPSAMAELLRAGAVPTTTQIINLAGEPLKNKLVQAIYQQTGVHTVYNLYGPSEDTTYSVFAPAERDVDHEPTIGRVIKYSHAYVLDTNLTPTPIGVPGELYLAGAGVARGYQGRGDLTAERFLPDPFGEEPGARMYRTGDKVTYRQDGEMLFLGRMDHQVKLRGFRIELGEIEAVLERAPSVQEAVVLVVTDDTGHQHLAAYLVPKPGLALDEDALRQHLQRFVPAYMIPSAFVFLDAIPLTPNGKTDRKALTKLNRPGKARAATAAPTSDLEKRVAAVWCDILHVDKVGLHDNFFEMGGNSLMVVQVHEQLKAQFQTDLTVVDLFTLPTVAALTARLDKGDQAAEELKAVDSLVKSQKDAMKRRKQKMKKQRRDLNV